MILPVAGLILFAVVSYKSALTNEELQRKPNRYFWWSSLRLDTDPWNQKPCSEEEGNCGSEDLSNRKVSPALLDKILIFSALPAFLAGAAVVVGLSKAGIDEVLSFMVSMPILLFGWYYLLGWLVDRWFHKRRQARTVQLKVT